MKKTMIASLILAGLVNIASAHTLSSNWFDSLRQALPGKTAPARAAGAAWLPVLVYDVQIEGTAGGTSFHTTGRLYLVAGTLPRMQQADVASETNILEVLLVAGVPGQPGSIAFSTHTTLLQKTGALNDLPLDIADLTAQDNGDTLDITVLPLKELLVLTGGHNSFVTQNGQPWQIAEGAMRLRLDAAGGLTGAADLSGMNLMTEAGETYAVRITGQLAGLAGVYAQDNTASAGTAIPKK